MLFRSADIEQFLKLIAFNILIGNHDAHAKNISLLHTPVGIRLAPFYDILSTQVYPVLDANLAMRINNKSRIADITPEDFKALARALDLNYKMIARINAEVADVGYSQAKALQAAFADEVGSSEIVDKIVAVIDKNRCVLVSSRV